MSRVKKVQIPNQEIDTDDTDKYVPLKKNKRVRRAIETAEFKESISDVNIDDDNAVFKDEITFNSDDSSSVNLSPAKSDSPKPNLNNKANSIEEHTELFVENIINVSTEIILQDFKEQKHKRTVMEQQHVSNVKRAIAKLNEQIKATIETKKALTKSLLQHMDYSQQNLDALIRLSERLCSSSNADKEVNVAQEKEIEKEKSDCISKMNSTSLKYITDQKAEIDDIWKNCLAKKLK